MKCKNCGKTVVKRMIGPQNCRREAWIHSKPDMTFAQIFDPKFDLTKVCMKPEPERSD
jgi:hypothetical protein